MAMENGPWIESMYFLLEMDDCPASYVSLPEGKWVISPTYKWDILGL